MTTTSKHICLLELALPPRVIGGAEIQAWELAQRLAERHRVTVVIRRARGEAATETRNGVEILRIPVSGAPFAMLSHLFHYLRVLRHLRKEVDVLIAFRAIPNGVVAVIAKWLWSIPCCVSIRGLDWYNYRHHPVGNRVLHWIAAHSSVIHTQTESIADDVRNMVAAAALVTIPNGIKPCPLKAHGQSMMYVGGLNAYKGVHILIEAMKLIPDRSLVIVGDGPERSRLEAQASGMNVSFRGYIAPNEVQRMMLDHGRILVLPTLTSEGLPNVLMQAMSVQLPVVATSIPGGIGDIVRHDHTGLLVAPGDAKALAEAICQLDRDETLRANMSTAALSQMEAFQWPRVMAQWETLLQDLLT